MLQLEPLRHQRIGHRIVLLEEATSTNDVVWQMSDGEEEGLVVFAEKQTAGRGQRGNRWESVAGKGLLFSVLLRPKILPNESSKLVTWAAQVLADVLRAQHSLGATLKLPNDIYVGEKKIAGVLLEMRAVPQAHVGILGIGINVNQKLEDFPPELRERATSISLLTGKQIDRRTLALALLDGLDRSYAP